MLLSTTGLILREVAYGESDKILTVLTPDQGKITVTAKGVRSYRNHYMSTAQLMCYNEFVLYQRGDRWWMKEAAVVEGFFAIREDLCRFALAQYCLDVANEVCVEGEEESAMLRLLLNTLYVLTKQEKSLPHIKAAFEMRAAALSGFSPDLSGCSACGERRAPFYYLNVADGVITCADCVGKAEGVAVHDAADGPIAPTILLPMDRSVVAAVGYLCTARAERVFAFSLGEELMHSFCNLCESYLLYHLERTFPTLAFYHSLAQTEKTIIEQEKPK